MSIASEALSVTGIGLLVVFVGLIILIAFIYLMAAAFTAGKKKPAETPAAEAVSAPAPAPVARPAVPAVEPGIDPQVVAVISAAIAAFDNSGKALVVRSVRRASAWNRAARTEQVYRF